MFISNKGDFLSVTSLVESVHNVASHSFMIGHQVQGISDYLSQHQWKTQQTRQAGHFLNKIRQCSTAPYSLNYHEITSTAVYPRFFSLGSSGQGLQRVLFFEDLGGGKATSWGKSVGQISVVQWSNPKTGFHYVASKSQPTTDESKACFLGFKYTNSLLFLQQSRRITRPLVPQLYLHHGALELDLRAARPSLYGFPNVGRAPLLVMSLSCISTLNPEEYSYSIPSQQCLEAA